MRSAIPAIVLVTLIALFACSRRGDGVEPPRTPDPSVARAPANATPVVISKDIREACAGYEMPRAYFEYDSASVRSEYQSEFSGLVRCFTEGPLKDRRLTVVGHADPRGGFDYNMVLGNSRAEAVRRELARAGLEERRVSTSSRGEMDAAGKDEATWARDRRVDLALAQ
jgi:peptidoglycan-associated lipoprotein